jgi:hypothetical protein
MVAGAFQQAAKQLREKIDEARKAAQQQEGTKEGATTH